MPSAEIVSIGSELLLGQIVDTNSAWMADRLTGLGVDLYYTTVVGDNPGRMREVLSRALDRSDLVITGGGLGPTEDDLTRETIAQATGRPLVRDPELLDQIECRFRGRGLIMTSNNERQADIPEGATPVANPNGTAPSFIVEDPRGVVFALPGVPFELKWLFDNEVVPYLTKRFGLSEVITYKVLKVADLGESTVDDRIGHLMVDSSNPTVGVLAHPGQVDVRIAAKASDLEAASKLIAPVEDEVRSILGSHVFAEDDETMEDAVGGMLRAKGVTIAVYEDITGGMVAERVLQAGGQEFFAGGLVGGGPGSGTRLLTPPADGFSDDPESFTQELSVAVRTRTGSAFGLAVHGVADLDDTSENLGRGQTYMSLTDGAKSKTRSYNYAGRGRPDRTRLSLNAVDLVRRALMEGMG